VSATEIVAIAGAISTPVVAIAGYVFSERRSRGDRAAARELADDAHSQERQLADAQRKHEAELRRRERLYTARRETYLGLLRQFLVEVQIVQRTEDLMHKREPPEMPPEYEWRDLRARVGAFGSPEVGEAVEMFDSKVRAFHEAVNVFGGTSDQLAEGRPIPPGIGPHTPMEEYRAMETARAEAVAAYDVVQTLVRDELANL
jgi:hypothetical protein